VWITHGQAARRRGDGVSRGQALGVAIAPRRAARLEDLGTAAAVNRTVHSSPAHQRRVRGVDDGVHLLRGDVALDEYDPRHGSASLGT
jgi:hypothetical protein